MRKAITVFLSLGLSLFLYWAVQMAERSHCRESQNQKTGEKRHQYLPCQKC